MDTVDRRSKAKKYIAFEEMKKSLIMINSGHIGALTNCANGNSVLDGRFLRSGSINDVMPASFLSERFTRKHKRAQNAINFRKENRHRHRF
jgi:hypothetical protein